MVHRTSGQAARTAGELLLPVPWLQNRPKCERAGRVSVSVKVFNPFQARAVHIIRPAHGRACARPGAPLDAADNHPFSARAPASASSTLRGTELSRPGLGLRRPAAATGGDGRGASGRAPASVAPDVERDPRDQQHRRDHDRHRGARAQPAAARACDPRRRSADGRRRSRGCGRRRLGLRHGTERVPRVLSAGRRRE
jgi:hypothetical protein